MKAQNKAVKPVTVTIRSSFELDPFIQRALVAGKVRIEQLFNAIKAALNDGMTNTASTDPKRMPAKLFTDKKLDSKPQKVRIKESLGENTFEGLATNPLRFVAWHDSMVAVWKAHGEPNGELTLSILPPHLAEWVTDKFILTKAAKATQDAKATVQHATDIAKRGNGDVSEVPKVTLPA